MIAIPYTANDSKLLLRGLHLELDDATRTLAESKAKRLFRHEPRIDRVRIDVAREPRGRSETFRAAGRIELAGPDLTASVTTDTPLASINLVIDKLDRMLRKRMSNLMRRRTSGDIRAYAALPAAV
ncbi:MAG TPA: HPF/RaiA family ribosome-associated protein [Opitutus sp.]|nr:HPF/RaiA family ribosome-associated protein [Opitutus sp.]